MRKKKYLPLYYKAMKKMELPYGECNGNSGGLCGLFDNDELFQLLKPTKRELVTTPIWGYWGCDEDSDCYGTKSWWFGPLRQNIVLFLAAMNGEL